MDFENPLQRAGAQRSSHLDGSFDVFTRLRQDFERGRFPWVGSFNDFCLGYLTFTSILHAHVESASKPVGSFVIGHTSTGKSQFLEALCRLLPHELIINLTTASAKSLIYECRSDPYYLNGKVIFIEELAGLRNPEVQYLIRVLLTKGYAAHTTVLSGQVERIEIYGAISLQSTGLSTDTLRDDTMNRLLVFQSDGSEARTRAVIENIKGRYTQHSLSKKDAFADYQEFFKGLKPYPVVIPYVDAIQFDTAKSETRRSSKLFMDLLATVALLNQAQRRVDREGQFLVSELDDLRILQEISQRPQEVAKVMLSPSQAAVASAMEQVPDRNRFTYQEILAANPSDTDGKTYELSSIKKALSRLRDLGRVEIVRNGRPVVFGVKKASGSNVFGMSIDTQS